MISFCTVARDTPDLDKLIDLFKKKCPGEVEICIGDNSTDPEYTEFYKELADVYVRVEDIEFFKMGIPWVHNRVVAQANSYKIFYMDSDEYPVWIHPELEDKLDLNYVINVQRVDFLTMEEIEKYSKFDYNALMNEKYLWKREPGLISRQDRVYNGRYAKFEGVCHSVFHVPQHFREQTVSVIVLHNKTVRDAKDLERMRDVIREQYARQNINNFLMSSPTVLGWGKHEKHKYEDYKEFQKAYS